MLRKSTIQLLRFRFSLLLLPVFLFALAMLPHIDWYRATVIFILLHFLLYPASNGYNSYMDRDEESIGDLEKPPPPTRQLFIVTVVMDVAGSLLSLLINPLFACLYIVYIIFSRLYSYRGIRLKQYPIIGYFTVVINQGALIFYMVYYGAGTEMLQAIPWLPMVVSTLLIGAFYPITQIYQHEQDRKDGVTTISYLLGIRGTFVYCALFYTTSFALLAWYFNDIKQLNYFFILQIWYLPVIGRFLWWTRQCWKDAGQANYRNTMYMNRLAAICTNMAFITLIIIRNFG